MWNFVLLVLKNLGRNKIRTALTSLAVTVLVIIYAVATNVIESVRKTVDSNAGQTMLFVTERWAVPSQVPIRYMQEISRIPGVDHWTTWNFYIGFFDKDFQANRMGVGIATRIESVREMHAGFENLSDDVIDRWKQERTGALVGVGLLQMMGWRVGQEFTVFSSTHIGKDLKFKILGVLPSGSWQLNFFFRSDYFQEGTGNKEVVDCCKLRVRDAETGRRVAAQIQQDFENRPASLKVETESAGAARFAEKAQVILDLIKLVVGILLIDMIIILSNSISIATRERRTEMAVLKVLGFRPTHVMAMVIGEATLIGAVSGIFGGLVAWGASELANRQILPPNGMTGFLLLFPVQLATVWNGFVLGGIVGFIGSAIPAWGARTVKVSEVFSKIA
jgi:putative ABC transport system permease protein